MNARQFLRQHQRFERLGVKMFRQAMFKSLSKIDWGKIEPWNYKFIIEFNFDDEPLKGFYERFYYSVGLTNGNRILKEIKVEQKALDPFNFQNGYLEWIKKWLFDFGGERIVSVKQGIIDQLIKIISDRSGQGVNIRVIAREIERTIKRKDFYRWQIERIVRTETTAASNLGAVNAGNSVNIAWEKEWIAQLDKRTRRNPTSDYDHWEMDGVRVDKNMKFDVNGDMLEFPGDTRGQAGNVINCRCSVAVVPKRDINGRLVFV